MYYTPQKYISDVIIPLELPMMMMMVAMGVLGCLLSLILIIFAIVYHIEGVKNSRQSYKSLLFILLVSIFVGFAGFSVFKHEQNEINQFEKHIENHQATKTVTLDFINNKGYAQFTDKKESNKIYMDYLDTSQQSLIHEINRKSEKENRKLKIKYSKYQDNYILLDIKPIEKDGK